MIEIATHLILWSKNLWVILPQLPPAPNPPTDLFGNLVDDHKGAVARGRHQLQHLISTHQVLPDLRQFVALKVFLKAEA